METKYHVSLFDADGRDDRFTRLGYPRDAVSLDAAESAAHDALREHDAAYAMIDLDKQTADGWETEKSWRVDLDGAKEV